MSSSLGRSGILISGYLYGRSTFEPRIILLQICCVQLAFYTSLVGCFLIGASFTGAPRSLQPLFDPGLMNLDSTLGRTSCFATIAGSALLAPFLAHVVKRSKKCPDFAFTCFVVHLFIVFIAHGFPRHTGWWVTNSLACLVVIGVAERICRQQETQEVRLVTDLDSVDDGTEAVFGRSAEDRRKISDAFGV